MSFQDLELGRALTFKGGLRHIEQGPSRAPVTGVFRINTALAGYKRLVYCIGTPKDTVDLRHKLHETRLHITQLVKETSAEIKHVRETNKFTRVDAAKKIADATRLTKDYESVLKDFEKAQLLAAEKQKAFDPVANSTRQSSCIAGLLEIRPLNPKQPSLLRESNRQVIYMENEITLNEAIIEETEQGIREIQTQIGEVNEIFRDLALLVSEQGALIGHLSINIVDTHDATAQSTSQLTKASNTQRSTSSMTCLMLVIVGIILVIVVFIVVE